LKGGNEKKVKEEKNPTDCREKSLNLVSVGADENSIGAFCLSLFWSERGAVQCGKEALFFVSDGLSSCLPACISSAFVTPWLSVAWGIIPQMAFISALSVRLLVLCCDGFCLRFLCRRRRRDVVEICFFRGRERGRCEIC